jgi:Uma2 family endonuclease
MATTTAATNTFPYVVDIDTFERLVLRPPPDFSDDDFFDFCQRPENELLRVERNAKGNIIIMAPVGYEGTFAEGKVYEQLSQWAERDGRGIALSANAGTKLPDGSTFAPDALWMTKETWKAIPRAIRKKFAPLVPPFVIEVRSPSDRKKELHRKMLAYLRNGVALGWLIDPLSRTVAIYKQGEPFVELENPSRVEGEGPVAGFVLDLKKIYDVLDA